MSVRLFAGISGHRPEIHVGDNVILDFAQMAVDEVHSRTSKSQSLGCSGCGRPWQQAVCSIKCGACAQKDYPRCTVLERCEGCGGEEALMGEWREHMRGHGA